MRKVRPRNGGDRLLVMKKLLLKLKKAVSPVFISLFVASFLLWYIAKLNYSYTTNYVAKLNIDGYRIEVPCVVEGQGTNLLNHKIKLGKRIRISMDELDCRPFLSEDSIRMIAIDPHSLQQALSVRISDIKIVSLGEVPAIVEDEE